MARKTADTNPAPQTTQADPTAPRPRDAQGHELDEHGLPLCGPARARRLVELEIADPALATDDAAAASDTPTPDAPHMGEETPA